MSSKILWLHKIDKEDLVQVGSKAVLSGELTKLGVKVPAGFVLNTSLFSDFLAENKLKEKLEELYQNLDYHNHQQVEETAKIFQKSILISQLDNDIKTVMYHHVKELSGKSKKLLALRLSPLETKVRPITDLVPISIINSSSENELGESLKIFWSALFSPKTLFLAKSTGIKFSQLKFAVIFQILISADSSGKIFTTRADKNQKKDIEIQTILGINDKSLSAFSGNDTYIVSKTDLKIKKKEIGKQWSQLVATKEKVREIPIPDMFSDCQKLTDENIVKLARLAKKIENNFLLPQEIDWALEDETIYILDTRVCELSEAIDFNPEKLLIENSMELISKVKPIYPGIASGFIKFLESKKIGKVNSGDIVVVDKFRKSHLDSLRKSSGIVVNQATNGATNTLLRQLGKPAVEGKVAPDLGGKLVTINAADGKIFKGSLPASRDRSLHQKTPKAQAIPEKTVTKVFVTASESELASEVAKKGVDGVGLLRAESLLVQLGDHPKKVLAEKQRGKFIAGLAKGISTFTSAFEERPVIYRASDFDSSEMRELDGGQNHEDEEKTPMLGFRGAKRFISEPEVFDLELEAIKEVRNKLGGKNLWLTIPFVRTTQEMEQIKKQISAAGLHRSSSFKLLLTVEVPTNIIQIEEFLNTGIDGICIDCNDLVSLLMGIDQRNAKVAADHSATNPAVLFSLQTIIKSSRKRKLFASISLSSSQLEAKLIDKLVEFGISAISVHPDETEKLRSLVYAAEIKAISSKKA